MKSVKELGEGIQTTLKVDGAMRKAASGLQTIDPRFLKPGAAELFRAMSEEKLKSITQQNSDILRLILIELAQHDSPDAVKEMQRLFRSKIVPYRLLAMGSLASMSTPAAARAIARRASFWSFASKDEKDLAKALLGRSGQTTCTSCSKLLRPFPTPPGPWTGTIDELDELKLEGDHGFVCEACRAVICPVCSGKKASELGVRQFVCTQCGAKPLKTIYRGQPTAKQKPAGSEAAASISLGELIRAKKPEDARKAVMACIDELQAKKPAVLLEQVDIDLGSNLPAFAALWTILDKTRQLQAETVPSQVRQLIDAFRAGGDFLASGATALNRNQGKGTLRRQDVGILAGCALLLKALDDQSSALGTGIRFVQVPVDQWVSFCEYLWERFYVDSDDLRSVLTKHNMTPPERLERQEV